MRRVPEKIAGWVAEYCPICRDVQAMTIKRVGTWEMRRLGNDYYVVDCSECGSRYGADPTTYLALASERADVKELMMCTQPRLPLRVLERVRFDRRAIQGDLPLPERTEALREPILRLAHVVPQRTRIEVPLIVLPAFLGMYIALLTGAWVAGFFDADSPPWPCLIALVPCVAASALLTRKVHMKRDRNCYKREIEPRLARAMRPLRPELDELRTMHAWMNATANPLTPFVEPSELLETVRKQPDRSLTNVDSMNLPAMAEAMWSELGGREEVTGSMPP